MNLGRSVFKYKFVIISDAVKYHIQALARRLVVFYTLFTMYLMGTGRNQVAFPGEEKALHEDYRKKGELQDMSGRCECISHEIKS